MKNRLNMFFLFGSVLLLLSMAGAVGTNGRLIMTPPTNLHTQNNNTSVSNTLSTSEAQGITWMAQEEKLARDVYTYLYNRWDDQIFNNIAQSEQTHINAVEGLIKEYNLTNPIANLSAGQFQERELKTLYNQLTTEGNKSLLAALKVGATIEELDIHDLETRISETNKTDIRMVYENLMKGSRNHLRAFYSRILQMNGTYSPKYITKEQFDSIVNSNRETGPIVDMQGNINPQNGSGNKTTKHGNGRGMINNKTGSGKQAMTNMGNESQYTPKNRTGVTGKFMGVNVNCPECRGMTKTQDTLVMQMRDGKNVTLSVSPNRVMTIATHKLGISNCTNCTIELSTKQIGTNSTFVYKVRARKTYRILGIFSVPAEVSIEVNAETGAVMGVQQPWWSFLAF